MDGVVADTEYLHYKSYIEALKPYGVFIEEQDYYDFWTTKGGRFTEYIKIHNLEAKGIEYEKIIKVKRELFKKFVNTEMVIDQKRITAIKLLAQNFPLALVTGSSTNQAKQILKLTNLTNCFKFIIGGEMHSKHKPDPECFLMASKKLNILPTNLVVIEDAQKGIIAAANGGMKSIAIPTKATKNDDFSLATKIVSHLSEITPEFLNKL